MTLRQIILLSFFFLVNPVLAERPVADPPKDIRNENWATQNFTCRVAGKTVTQSESRRQVGVMMYMVTLSANGELISQLEELSGFPAKAYLKTTTGWVLFETAVTGDTKKYREALPAALGLTAPQWDECGRSFARN